MNSAEAEPAAPGSTVPETSKTETTTATGPRWPELAENHPLRKLQGRLGSIIEETGYNEMWGVQLSAATEGAETPFTTTLVLQKFLRANANDLDKAAEQLKNALQWRKEFQPLKTAREETFDESKFGGLGYLTVVDRKDGEGKEIITWNIYGAVKDNQKTFGALDEFIRWRVGLMELAIQHLNLSSATVPIPDHGQGPDPYQMVQIHDYRNVRFLRMDPTIRAASSKTISLFQQYYPEMLSRKFFVNVPLVMSWLFAAMKLVVARETSRKLSMLSYGEQLVHELGDKIPSTYGGTGPKLEDCAETVRLEKGQEETKATESEPADPAGQKAPNASAVDAVQHMQAKS